MPLHHLATIAVLGADTVVGSALCALLGDAATASTRSTPAPRGSSASC
jgi:hypothetical protein